MYPFATQTVQRIVIKTMTDRADELITKLQNAPNDEAMVRRLKDEKPMLFFRAAIINDKQRLLYDTANRLHSPQYSRDRIVDNPEVIQAIRKGTGYHEDYSDLLRGQKFVYIARTFDFHGKPYILRAAFPNRYMTELTRDFKMGATALATAMLLMFSLITWFIINYLTRPMLEIIKAIKPYQDGEVTSLPEIKTGKINPDDEFGRLANTLNTLSSKIQGQINTLTFERNQKEAVLESLVEGVVAVNKDMMVTFVNNSALRFFGVERHELIGHNIAECKDSHCYNMARKCLKEARVLTETYNIDSGDQKYFIDLIASPIKNSPGAVLVLQDKTTHYKLLEMRKDFIANASHELKTPITIIQGFAETLHDYPDLAPEMKADITKTIHRNCVKMTELIQDLLALTDVENLPESRLIECDIVGILEECCNDVKELFPDANIKFQVDGDNRIMIGDPNLLELALKNLIENGAKYSTPPADVTVKVKLTDRLIEIAITDKGFGIAPEEQGRIFQRFYRIEGTRQKVGGSGLGLSLVEMIIEKHFGKIRLNSKLGKGSTFTVQLPRQRFPT
jgi:PAS domain S-box-containing protein